MNTCGTIVIGISQRKRTGDSEIQRGRRGNGNRPTIHAPSAKTATSQHRNQRNQR